MAPEAGLEMQAMPAPLIQVQRLDNRDLATADAIHRLLRSAREQESDAVGAEPGPAPALQQIQASTDVHLGALEAGALVGVVAVGPDEDPRQLELKWLAVPAERQRRGIARALLTQVFTGGAAHFVVTVAEANTRAMALYRSMGFVEGRRGVLGPQGIPVVSLHGPRSP